MATTFAQQIQMHYLYTSLESVSNHAVTLMQQSKGQKWMHKKDQTQTKAGKIEPDPTRKEDCLVDALRGVGSSANIGILDEIVSCQHRNCADKCKDNCKDAALIGTNHKKQHSIESILGDNRLTAQRRDSMENMSVPYTQPGWYTHWR